MNIQSARAELCNPPRMTWVPMLLEAGLVVAIAMVQAGSVRTQSQMVPEPEHDWRDAGGSATRGGGTEDKLSPGRTGLDNLQRSVLVANFADSMSVFVKYAGF